MVAARLHVYLSYADAPAALRWLEAGATASYGAVSYFTHCWSPGYSDWL